MKNTVIELSRNKTDLYLNKKRMMKLVKTLNETPVKDVFEYSNKIDLQNKFQSYMVGSTLFE